MAGRQENDGSSPVRRRHHSGGCRATSWKAFNPNTGHVAAHEASESFVPYRAAELWLKKALVAVAAGDRPALITRVFGPQ
jgi:hypothetical protein